MRIIQRIRETIFPIRRRINYLIRPDVWHGGPPNGSFCEWDALTAGLVEGAVRQHGQTYPPISTDSEILQAGLNQAAHADWITLWTRRDDAMLAGPSLAHIDSRGKVCREATYGPHTCADPVWNRRFPRPLRHLTGDFTSIISLWNAGSNYYHWFLDGLTRLVHLADFPPDCRILIPRHSPPFARRSLELMGLAGRVVEAGDEDLKIERYWFAGPTTISGCPDPLGVDWLRKQFPTGSDSQRHRLLYIDRQAATRNLTNARELRDWFGDRGWEVVDPGELSLDAQIHLFQEARAVAGAHGAALTNLLWTAPSTHVLEFMPSRRRNGCYAGISLVVGQPHRSLICPSNRQGDMKVPLAELSALVAPMEEPP